MSAYFDTYMDEDAKDFIYTKYNFERFPLPHLKVGAWYIDCVEGYMSLAEDDLYRNLVEVARVVVVVVVEDDVEPLPPVEVEKEKGE